MSKKTSHQNAAVAETLKEHFGKFPLQDLISASRTFPVTAKVDLQHALESVLQGSLNAKLMGVHREQGFDTLTFAHLVAASDHPVVIGPLQYAEVDLGDATPARCLKHGLWLGSTEGMPFLLLLSPAEHFGRGEGMHLEIAVPLGKQGLEFSQSLLNELEKRVNQAASYRGKVISLEAVSNYSGKAGTVRVHKLRSVSRDQVILPEATLKLLERNINGFIQQREALRKMGMSIKKGLLFYGPPGTGKTHTIHYLASQLPDHTTLLITAAEVALLDEYVQLARFLQPSIVVLEDVDLIARSRKSMRGPCEESLLNKLLNEMDGLREDAAVLFILTTNRPQDLEEALASRPGRIDQAIEFPLPDAEGRRKLITLYAKGLAVPSDVLEATVHRTEKASAAFLKELMRRSAQILLQAGDGPNLRLEHIDSALDEMLFTGGSLNVKLLGGAATG
jgi:AAA+ superfamily predicted ATPase